MSLWRWSRTAASNASADPSINFAEGQPPSSLNDSNRAAMAATAKYRDDIAGAIATGGTSTAYTVASYQSFDTLAHLDGAMIAFTPHTGNGATVTLNVDSLGAKPLRPAPSVELQSGALIQGTPYLALYNNSDAVWYLHGASNYNSYSCPLGGGMIYFGSTAPNSAFVFPFGQAISRTTYATLFSLIGTTYGAGDTTTTFNVPDLCGRVPVGLDNMGGTPKGRLNTIGSGTTLGAAGGEQTHALTTAELASHTHTGNTSTESAVHTHTITAPTANTTQSGGSGNGPIYWTGTQTITTSSESASHTHPFTSDAAGSGTAHNNLQPTLMVNYIIRII